MSRTKGSKNKLKVIDTVKIGQKYPPPSPPSITVTCCKICDRVCFGNFVTLPYGQWRHDICAIGSEEWNLYYQRQSKATKAKLTEFAQYYEGVER